MKKLLHIILFTLFSIQAQAASLTWDIENSDINSIGFKSQVNEPDRQSLTGGIDFSREHGPSTIDTWAFNLSGAGEGGISVDSIIIEFTNTQMDIGSITLDGNAFSADNGEVTNIWSAGATLNDGLHFVVLNDINVLDEAAQYDIKVSLGEGGSVSAVPVPAAAWMFGSGLIGLVGFSRRKSKS